MERFIPIVFRKESFHGDKPEHEGGSRRARHRARTDHRRALRARPSALPEHRISNGSESRRSSTSGGCENTRASRSRSGRCGRCENGDARGEARDHRRRPAPAAPRSGDEAARARRVGAIRSASSADEALVEYLNRAHLLVNPSPKEGWGLTVVEANACGLPVVASDRPGLRDSVRDGETGFLVPYGDAGAFASKSLAILGDRALWRIA